MSTFPGLVFASGVTPSVQPVYEERRYGISLWLVPDDESLPTWRLTNGEDNGIILMPGMRGLGKAESQEFAEEYASIDGEYYFGERTLPREVFLPLHVFHDGSSQDWIDRDSLLWKSFRRGAHSTLYAQHPNGTIRSLRVRYARGGEEGYDLDPSFFGWATYGIYLRASQPHWEGAAVFQEWVQSEQPPFYSAEAPALPFNISYPSFTEFGYMTNPGDIDVWPKVTLSDGIAPGAEIVIAGGSVQVPFEIPDGEILVIDYSPSEQSAFLDGVDVTRDLGTYGFRRFPAGEQVQVGIDLAGTSGKARIDLVPRYERAL